jgi:DNA polymerase III alpha subunit
MWMKIHYPAAFYAASLRKEEDEGKLLKLIRDAKSHGVEVLPPDLTRSGMTWTLNEDGDEILAGFMQVKGIGEKMAEEILRDREANGAFKGWADLLRVKGIGPAKLLVIREFAESDDPFGLERVARMLAAVRKAVEAGEIQVPMRTHGSDDLSTMDDVRRVVWWGVVGKIEYKDLIEDERAKTGQDIEEIKARIRSPHKVKSATLHCYDDGLEDVYLRVNRWNFPKFRRKIESIRPGEDVVVAIGQKRKAFGVSLQLRSIHIIDPEV